MYISLKMGVHHISTFSKINDLAIEEASIFRLYIINLQMTPKAISIDGRQTNIHIVVLAAARSKARILLLMMMHCLLLPSCE